MVVYQGPILDSEMELGATGFWNNTMRPGVYYLKNRNSYFDATRAEIVGDIDGKYLCKQYLYIISSCCRKVLYYTITSAIYCLFLLNL